MPAHLSLHAAPLPTLILDHDTPMSFRLKIHGHLGADLRRLATQQIAGAVDQLERAYCADPVEATHATRKHLKKLRALLQLARGELRPRVYRQEDACFRIAGRALGELRDAQVLVKSVSALEAQLGGSPSAPLLARLRRRLARLDQRKFPAAQSSRIVSEVISLLRGAALRAKCWRLAGFRWKDARNAIQESYRQARRGFRTAAEAPTVENLHAWRKRAKVLWYHIRLLRRASPSVLEELARELHALTEMLGEDHDFALLEAALGALPARSITVRESDALHGLIEERRGSLQRSAFALAEQLFADRPSDFACHLAAARKVHRKQKTAAPVPPEEELPSAN